MNVTILSTMLMVTMTAQISHATPLQSGTWRAWLDSPGGPLPFILDLHREGAAWRAVIHNGQERIDIPTVTLSGENLTLGFDHYDSTITAKVSSDGQSLEGVWRKQSNGKKVSTLLFHATAGQAVRFERSEGNGKPPSSGQDVTGRWAVTFSKSEDPAIAQFKQHPDGTVTGTVMTTTGDYRFLDGDFYNSQLRLSTFDGAHAFLFHAKWQADDTLAGDFWSRDAWHESWTARRDEAAKLPDDFSQTKIIQGVDLKSFSYRDLKGKTKSLGDESFAGKVMLIEIFGSWCPNCHDASQLMVELDREYHGRGLQIIGLAFELTDDFARDVRQVRRFVKKHDVNYPILIAGVSDKATASKQVPFIDKVRSYPTAIFVDRTGVARYVHTGFTGPATGQTYEALRSSFKQRIESLLSE